MKKFILVLTIILILVGCNKTPELDYVRNIRFEDNLLVWDSVENAEKYHFMFGEIGGIVHTNSLDLIDFDLESGEHTITIYASASGFKDSKKISYKFSYTRPENDQIKNLRVEEKFLKWDEVTGESYIVIIEDNEFEVTTNEYDLSGLDKNKIYEIKVKLLGSDLSKTIIYDAFELLDYEFEHKYQKQTAQDLKISLGDFEGELINIKMHSGEYLSNDDYVINNNLLTFKSNYLNTLDVGNNVFTVYSSIGKFNVIVVVTDDKKPYLRSNNTVTFTGEDVEFEFEIFDGEILKVSVSGITEDDYIIDGNKLIIKKEYISKVFNENEERNSLIIIYHLKANSNYVIGSVQIKRS